MKTLGMALRIKPRSVEPPGILIPTVDMSIVGKWKDAIANDDIDMVKGIFEEGDAAIIEEFLYGHLPSTSLRKCGHNKLSCECYPSIPKEIGSLSLNLAVAARAKNVLSFLITKGVKTSNEAWQKPYCYVIHCIVYNAYFMPDEEQEYVELFIWLKDILPSGSLKTLLRQENFEGCYPLELAAQLECFRLFQAIFDTDVYVSTRVKDDLLYYTWYDVTDYEHPQAKRRNRSPLLYFCKTNRSSFNVSSVTDFLESGMVKKWFNCKYTALRKPIIVMSILELIRMVVFIIINYADIPEHRVQNLSELYETNGSIHEETNTCYWHLDFNVHLCFVCLLMVCNAFYLFFSTVFIFFEIRVHKGLQTKIKIKDPAISIVFFRFVFLSFSASVLLKTFILFLKLLNFHQLPVFVVNMVGITVTTSLPWMVLIFLQITKLNYFSIIFQEMLTDFFNFLLVQLIFLIAYGLGFFSLLSSEGKDCSKAAPGFNKFDSIFYSIFTMMLNMVSLDTYDIEDRFNLQVLHILFVTMVPIVLINFLIALFSDSVQRVMKYKKHLQRFQFFMHFYIADFFMWWIIPKYYEKHQKVAFAHNDDRYYLVVTSALKPFNSAFLN